MKDEILKIVDEAVESGTFSVKAAIESMEKECEELRERLASTSQH